MATEEIGLRLRADGVLETTTGIEVTSKLLKRLSDNAREASDSLAGTGVSAGQTRAAMRQLPAQITDIWTSLASGQAPMTVAIQQGGQIKDSFGGVAPAARAMAGALGPVGMAAIAAAGGIGLLALAYTQGKEEGDAFFRSIVLTGNASGTSMSQLDAMARSLGRVVGTQHEAAGVLAQLNNSGQVAAASLQRFGEVAMRLDRVGIPVADTVKQFVELGKAPIEASVKLNEQYNYLTKAIYDQIVALEKQGRTAEAADLAQSTFAEAQKKNAEQLEGQLGTLERAWKSVGEAAMGAWGWMLGIGREDTLQVQLEKAQKELAAFEANMPKAPTAMVDAQRLALMQAQRDTLRNTVETLRMQVYMEGEVAAAQGTSAARTRQQIADAEKARKAGNGAATRERPELNSWSAYSTWGDAGRREVGYAAELERQMAEDRQKAIDAETKLIERNAQAIEREAATLATHTGELGLNAEQLLARRQAVIDGQIAEASARLQMVQGSEDLNAQTEALKRQIAALQALRQAQGQAFERQQTVDAGKAAEKARAEDEAQRRKRSESIATSIEDGIMNGFRNGQSFADIFLNELKAQFARTVLRPIISPVADMLAGVGGGGGGFGGLLGGLFSIFGGGIDPSAGLGNGAPFGGVGAFHAGGHAGWDGPTFTRMMPAAAFAGAPRFHTGVGPNELPAVIKRDEGVFTAGQMRAMAPVSALEKAAPRITFAPTVNIDSRTDRAEVAALVQVQMRRSQAELLDMMDRGMA